MWAAAAEALQANRVWQPAAVVPQVHIQSL
jgi:hypothetical protein